MRFSPSALAAVLVFALLASPASVFAANDAPTSGNRDNSRVVPPGDTTRMTDSSAIKNQQRNKSKTDARKGATDRTMPRDTLADTNLVPTRPGY